MKSIYRIKNRPEWYDITPYPPYNRKRMKSGLNKLTALLRMLKGKTAWLKVREEPIIGTPYREYNSEFIVEFELE